MKSTDRKLKKGDVVQLLAAAGPPLAGSFMIVTAVKPWGANGYVRSVTNGTGGVISIRAEWNQMEYIGEAFWEPKDE